LKIRRTEALSGKKSDYSFTGRKGKGSAGKREETANVTPTSVEEKR